MTPLQIARIQQKIAKIKRELAADKRRHGGVYDDSRGLRYLPPSLYLQLQDFKGAMGYYRWFSKNFDDDSGYPIFLFEWCITLFKNGRMSDAKNLGLLTFFSNTYLIDSFLGTERTQANIAEQSNWEGVEILKGFPYSCSDPWLSDFASWLSGFVLSDTFQQYSHEFLTIKQKLSHEPPGISRSELVRRLYAMIDRFTLR